MAALRIAEFGVQDLGDAEVEQLGHAVGAHQHVGRLDVAVHDALVMRVRQRRGDLLQEQQALLQIQILPLTPQVERKPLHELHDEVAAAILGHAAAEQARDVRVVERVQHLALQLEALQHRVAVHAALQQLDRHATLQQVAFLHGQPHVAEAAAAQTLLDAAVADALQAGFGTQRGECTTPRCGGRHGAIGVRRNGAIHVATRRHRAIVLRVTVGAGWFRCVAHGIPSSTE